MKKLAISQISDKTIRIEDFVNKTKNVYAAEFIAQGNELKGTVKICDTTESTVYLALYTEIEVNGSSPANVQDAVNKLNSFIGNFSSGGSTSGEDGSEDDDVYVRPSDRPTKPAFAPDEQAIYWLFGVQEHGLNDYCFQLTESSGNYKVDWGDGTIETVASNTVTEHKYDFSTLNVPVGSEGYKWVWIKAMPSAGNITALNFTGNNCSWRPALNTEIKFLTQVFEIYLQSKYVTSMYFPDNYSRKFHFMCEIFEFYGENNMTAGCTDFLFDFYSLRRLKIDTIKWKNFFGFLRGCCSFNQSLDNLDTSNGTNFDDFLHAASSFNRRLNIDTGNALTLRHFLANCRAYNKPLILNTSKCYNFDDFMSGCSLFNNELKIDLVSATTMNYFLYQCYVFNQDLNLNTSKVTTFINCLYRTYSLNKKVELDLSSATDIRGLFQYNWSMTNVRLKNISVAVSQLDFAASAMDANAVMDLLPDLPDRTGIAAGTLNLIGTPASLQLTPVQIALFTARNWNIKTA